MSETKRGSRRLKPEERKLWGEIMRSVAPLRRQAGPADQISSEATGETAPSTKSPAPAPSAPVPSRPAPRLEPFERRLKQQVPEWLRLPEFRRYVSGFEAAHTRHGGAGALYVRVRRQKSGDSPDF